MAFDNLPRDPQQEGDEREQQWHRPVNAAQSGRLPEGFGVAPAARPATDDAAGVQAEPAPSPSAAPSPDVSEAGQAYVMAQSAPEQHRRTFWQRKAPAVAVAALLLAGVVAGSGVTYGMMKARTPGLYTQPRSTGTPTQRPVAYALNGANLTSLYQTVAPSVVRITETAKVSTFFGSQTAEGVGTGIVIDAEGHILTNNHVVSDGGKIMVEFYGGKKVEGVVLSTDPGDDLAMIKVDPKGLDLHPAELGDSDAVQVGEPVVAIGNPFGDYGWSISSGIVSGKDRPLRTASGRGIKGLLQTDAAINPGNSGGPLLDLNGRVIGINTAIESPVKGSVGIGFAIPVNLARTVMNDLMSGASVNHPWLGVGMGEINASIQEKFKLPVDKGLLLSDIFAKSPAENAGLRPTYQTRNGGTVVGDIVTGVDAITIEHSQDLGDYLGSKKVGDKIVLHIIRGGKPMDVPVTLGAWPKELQNTEE